MEPEFREDDNGLILSQKEAKEWREMHLKGYDTRLWSLESNNGLSPSEVDHHKSVQSLEVDSIDEGSLRSVSPFSYRPPSIVQRRISQAEKPSKQQLILEKERLERLIKIREYQLSQFRSSDIISLPSRKDLLDEKRHLIRLKHERQMQLKRKAHDEWRKLTVKQKKNETVREIDIDPSGINRDTKYEELSYDSEEPSDKGEHEFNEIFPCQGGIRYSSDNSEYPKQIPSPRFEIHHGKVQDTEVQDRSVQGSERGITSEDEPEELERDEEEEEDEILLVLVREEYYQVYRTSFSSHR